MYLYKKTYVKHWDHNGHDNYKVEITKAGQKTNIRPERICYITEEIGYWRKANHIHNWFVKNVQNGNDDCGSYYVSRVKLEELRKLCDDVLSNVNRADELLPTTSGFFFGNTEYDDYYFDSIKDTIEIIDECLSDAAADDFEYNSSW